MSAKEHPAYKLACRYVDQHNTGDIFHRIEVRLNQYLQNPNDDINDNILAYIIYILANTDLVNKHLGDCAASLNGVINAVTKLDKKIEKLESIIKDKS